MFTLALVAAALALPAPAAATAHRPPPPRAAVIVLENKEYGQVVGDRSAPFLNALARRSAVATNAFGVSHPSLPNYLALATGTTAGVTSDCHPADCPVDRRSLPGQLDAAGISWGAYMEGMPSPCARQDAGRYAPKHDPFAYLTPLRASCRRHVLGFGALAANLRARRLPRFTWITPDLCHDMHDCSIAVGDGWLRRWAPRVVAALGPRGILIITFDEGSSNRHGGGQILTLVTGPGARPRARLPRLVTHYGTLATLEDRFGLPRLAGARRARTLSALLRQR